ncbi:uncharacterized protein LOC120281157 [Dioscorea cayenensis subsp. rotundata]|uniref:Uncharacterized protein LOC120281157 n=1 Tax=Dioscorea cayennensis subsp. rotundata TaxID=55577 RepID=A0AB40CX67_DIOCR|nr:uncharacterized protein LOC120281157 [Dioscorea cayenensis subsp. rotundata]
MGNCAPKPKRSSPPPRRSSSPVPATMTFQLFGSESCPIAARIRISLSTSTPPSSSSPRNPQSSATPVLRCGSQSISGSADMILRYIDSTFHGPPSPAENGTDRSSAAAELRNAVALQHRSIERHLEGVSRWAEEIASGGGGGRIAAGRRYAELVEIMLEHAQMEERFLFPLLERAAEDRGLCGVAYGKHAKELPMMNGIKEDMKSVMAMGPKALCYLEAMLNLSQRLKTLQEHLQRALPERGKRTTTTTKHCREYWQRRRRNREMVGQSHGAHGGHTLSTPFPSSCVRPPPHESMKYIELLCKSIKDQQQLLLLLKSLITSLERER